MAHSVRQEQEIRRTLEGLQSCCDLLERLLPFLQRLLSREEGSKDMRGSVRVALGRLQAVSDRLLRGLEGEPETLGGEDAQDVAARCATTLLHTPLRPSAPAQSLGVCVLRGQSPATPIAAVLELLHAHRKSGVLQVVSSEETFTIELDRGCITHAVSDATPPAQRLGEILVRRGVIDRGDLDRLLEDLAGSSGTMGEALQRDYGFEEEALRAALEEQVQHLFHRVFSAPQSAFHFFECDAKRPRINIRLHVIQLLLESARTRDEGTLAPRTPADAG